MGDTGPLISMRTFSHSLAFSASAIYLLLNPICTSGPSTCADMESLIFPSAVSQKIFTPLDSKVQRMGLFARSLMMMEAREMLSKKGFTSMVTFVCDVVGIAFL